MNPQELPPQHYLRALWQRRWLIVLTTLVALGATYMFGTDRVFLCKNPVVIDAQGQIRECINSTQDFQRTSGRGAFYVDVEPLQVYGGLGFRIAFVGN